jgi:hypothetical protein
MWYSGANTLARGGVCVRLRNIIRLFGWRTLLNWGLAMDHLPSSNIANSPLHDAQFADERSRYLSHCAAHGARPAVLTSSALSSCKSRDVSARTPTAASA